MEFELGAMRFFFWQTESYLPSNNLRKRKGKAS
jgi:hypothetical protein